MLRFKLRIFELTKVALAVLICVIFSSCQSSENQFWQERYKQIQSRLDKDLDPALDQDSGRSGDSLDDDGEYQGQTELAKKKPEELKSEELKPEKLSQLDSLLSVAARRSPRLRAAFEVWSEARTVAPQVSQLPNPTISWSYYIRSLETRAGPIRNRFGVAQQIPWPGRLSSLSKAANSKAEAAYFQFRDQEQQLFLEIKLAYAEYYYLKQAKTIQKQGLELLKYYESVARARYKTAATNHPEIIRIQLEFGQLDEKINTIETQRKVIQAKLNGILNRGPTVSLPWPDNLPTEVSTELDTNNIDRQQLVARFRENNEKYQSIVAKIRSQDQQINAAKTSFYPDFKVALDYFDTASAIRPNTPDSSDDAIALTVGLSLPIWWQKNRAKVSQARATKRKLYAQKIALIRSLDAELETVLLDLETAKRRIQLYDKTLIPRAREGQQTLIQSFKTYKGDFLSLIDLLRTQLDLELKLQRAVTNKFKAQAKLVRIIGDASNRSPK